jgi:hypothetical protein
MMMIFPVALITYARRRGHFETNFHASPFQHIAWQILIMCFAIMTLYFVIVGIINGSAGH